MPVDPHLVRRAIEARDRFEQTQAEALRARDAFHDAVDAMHRSGASLREIAEALGVSHQRVHQMVDSGGRPSLWARTTRRGPRPRRVTQCSFCGKGQDAVAKLVAGPGVFICNECIGVAGRAVALGEAQAGEHARFEILPEASASRCNFCGKRAREVEAMATGAGGAICDQCLALCQEILAEDRASAGE